MSITDQSDSGIRGKALGVFTTEIDAQISIATHYAGPEHYVTVLNPRPSTWVVYVDSDPTKVASDEGQR